MMETGTITKKKDLSAGYNRYKKFGGQQYTGMQSGRGYRWHLDEGDWGEAIPISETCNNDICYERDVSLNGQTLGSSAAGKKRLENAPHGTGPSRRHW